MTVENFENVLTLDALRVAPAAHLAADMEAATVTGERSVALRELAFLPQLGVRAVPGSASAAAVEASLGVTLPSGVGQVTGDAAGVHALWLGPSEFLVVDASRRQQPGEELEAAAALEGLPGQVMDLSGNRTVLELSGAKAREVLEKGCHADLHPSVFQVGQAIVTAVGPVPVYLHHAEQDTYRLYPRASFADYLVRWLLDGMLEYAGDEVR